MQVLLATKQKGAMKTQSSRIIHQQQHPLPTVLRYQYTTTITKLGTTLSGFRDNFT